MNHVSLTGKVIRYEEFGGGKVGRFTLSFDSGTRNNPTRSYIVVSVFGPSAELSRAMNRSPIATVLGRLEQNKWETKDGQKRSEIRLVANERDISFHLRPTSEVRRAAQEMPQEPQNRRSTRPQQPPARRPAPPPQRQPEPATEPEWSDDGFDPSEGYDDTDVPF